MIKVLFNSDGSLKAFDLPQYITQGSSGEIDALRLEVAVDGVDLVSDDLTVKAQFTLPNGDTNALLFDKDIGEFTIYGKVYGEGKAVYLTEGQTYYSGVLLVSIAVFDANLNTLYTYKCKLTINPTTYQPDSESTSINNAQYNNIGLLMTQLKNQISQINGQLRTFATLSDAEDNIRDLVLGQIIFVDETNELYIVRDNDNDNNDDDDDAKILVLISRNKIVGIECDDATNPPYSGTITETSLAYNLNNNLVEAIYFYDANGKTNFYIFENNNGTTTTFSKLIVGFGGVDKDKRLVTNSSGVYSKSTEICSLYTKAYLYKHILSIPVTSTSTSGTITMGTCYATLYNNSSTPITSESLLKSALSTNEELPAWGSVSSTSFYGIYKNSSGSIEFQASILSGIIAISGTITDTITTIALPLAFS